MRVLFVTSFYEYDFGGAELVMRRLRSGLERRGHQIGVLCLAGGGQPQSGTIWRISLPEQLQRRPQLLKRLVIFLNNALFDEYLLAQARRVFLPLATYDLIHCQDVHSVMLASRLARDAGKKVGLTMQENLPREFEPGQFNRFLREIVQCGLDFRDRVIATALRDLAWITAPSNRIARNTRLFVGLNGPPVHTIYSPYPAEFPFGECVPGRRACGAKILFMGRLSAEKGIDLLLEALAQWTDPWELTILGLDGPLKSLVAKRAAADVRIRLRAPVPHGQVHEIIQQHDIICCPSIWNDPLPGSVIEARLHGKAILASDRGGIPEILEGYSKAVMVPTGGKTRSELVEAIRRALSETAELVDRAPNPDSEQLFRQRFSPEHFIDQFERLYATGNPAPS